MCHKNYGVGFGMLRMALKKKDTSVLCSCFELSCTAAVRVTSSLLWKIYFNVMQHKNTNVSANMWKTK
jgi:hypothetical protein